MLCSASSNAQVVTRARAQAGNLAMAIRTPLAAMAQAAADVDRRPDANAALAPLVREQAALALRQVDLHPARSRSLAAAGLPGARADVAPCRSRACCACSSACITRVAWAMRCEPIAPDCSFAGEAQDLQETAQRARQCLQVGARRGPRRGRPGGDAGAQRLRITVDEVTAPA